MLIRRALAALAMLALLPACGTSAQPGSYETPLVVGTTVPSLIQVAVEGDETFTFSGIVPLRIVTGGQNPDVPESIRLLNFGLLAPVELRDGRLMRPAFDILGFTGKGTYRYGPGVEPPAGAAPGGLESDVLIELTTIGQSFVTFNELKKPCTVEVADDGARAGSLSCPQVADERDRVISIRWTWSPQ